MDKERDNFEFALSQYADGTLNELDRHVVDDRLATDAEARLLLSDFLRVDHVLRDGRELPAIDFDAFGARIADAIATEKQHVGSPIKMPFRRVAAFAIAAAVAVAAIVGVKMQTGSTPPPMAAGSAVIQGPSIETASAAPDIRIGVGPSDALAKRGDTLTLGNEAIAPPAPKVVIGSARTPSKDDVRPY